MILARTEVNAIHRLALLGDSFDAETVMDLIETLSERDAEIDELLNDARAVSRALEDGEAS